MPSNKENMNCEADIEGSDEFEVRKLMIEERQRRVLANLGKTVNEIEADLPHKTLSAED